MKIADEGNAEGLPAKQETEMVNTLAASEERFRQLAETIADVFWLSDPANTKIFYVSPAYEKIWGRSCESLYASPRSWAEAIHPDDRPGFHEGQARTLEKGSSEKTYRILRPDGSIRWILDRVFAVRDESGHLVRVAGIAKDITERKQAEDQLRERERRLSTLISNLPGVVFRVRNDPNYTTEYVSDQIAELTGYPADDFRENRRSFGELMHPDDRDRVWNEIQQALGEHRPYELTYRFIGARGREQWNWEKGMGVYAANGELQAVEGFVQDITERKQAEAALRESEARLRLSVAASGIGLWDWNIVTNDVYFSPEWKAQLGCADDEIPNRFEEWESRLHPDDLAPTMAKVRAFIENPEAHYAVEFRMRHKDGSWRWIFTQAQIFRNAAGQPQRMMGCHIDITERQRSEAERTRLLHVLEASLNEIYTFDPQTLRFQYANYGAQRNLGYSMEAMRALTPLDLKPEFSEAAFNELIEPLRRREKQMLIFQTVHRRADGSLYPVEVHLQLVERDGEAVFLAVINDITERHQAVEKLRMLSLQLSRTEEEQRRQIARELHDSTGQKLAALKMTVGLLQDATSTRDGKTEKMFADCLAMIDQCSQEIRTHSYLLHPPLLDELGLSAAISNYVEGFSKRSGVRVQFDPPPDFERFPDLLEIALFRVVQESMGNIHRHAGTASARIRLACDAEHVTLEVSDQGHGISPEMLHAVPAGRGATGVGIAGMRERLRLLGGRLEIESGKHGTTVRAVVPQRPDPA